MSPRKALITILLSCTLGLQSIPVYGQHFQEQILQTKISSVTLFLEGAQVFESGQANLPAGNVSLIVKGLSPFIDPAVSRFVETEPLPSSQ